MQSFFHRHKILVPLSQVAPQHSSIPECRFRMFGLRKSEQKILPDCYRHISDPFTTYNAFIIFQYGKVAQEHLMTISPPVDGPTAKVPGGQTTCSRPAGARKRAGLVHAALLGHQHMEYSPGIADMGSSPNTTCKLLAPSSTNKGSCNLL